MTYMLGIFTGVLIAVLAGLILYHGFGIGKEKKPIPLSRGIKLDLEKISINPSLAGADGLVERLIVNVNIRINNLSSKKITIRNPRAELKLPDGYSAGFVSGDPNHDRDIGGDDFLPAWYIFNVRIVGDNQHMRNEPEWQVNRNKILENFSSAKIAFRFTADAISNDDSITIDKTFDITSTVQTYLKR